MQSNGLGQARLGWRVDWLVQRGATLWPDVIAVCDADRSYSYAQFETAIEHAAQRLRARGCGAGSPVCLLAHNQADWLVYFFAIVRSGGVVVPVDHLTAVAEVVHVLDDCEAELLVHGDELTTKAHACRALRPGLSCLAFGERLDVRGPEQPESDSATAELLRRSHAILLQYTSGTSGARKAAVHTHETMLVNAAHQISDFEIAPGAVSLVVPSLSWSAGLQDFTLATLWRGGTLVIFPSSGFDPLHLVRTVTAHQVTHLFMAPALLRPLADLPCSADADLSRITLLLTGGDHVPGGLVDDLIGRFGDIPVRPSYGMSELPSTMLMMPVAERTLRPGSVGRPTLAAELRIVDSEGLVLPTGDAGELECRSPATMIGYLDGGAISLDSFRDGWFRTGDVARVDADGYYYIVGRSKDMLISGGLNVYPAEVEAAIEKHPAVSESAVVACPDDHWGEVPLAFVVLRPGCQVTGDELTDHLRQLLAGYKIPKHYELREDPLPRSSAGKLLKGQLVRG
jgi:fatty-acyl-CoA synthase